MNKSVYICHRPYQILRCCDLISKKSEKGYNILITFDIKVLGKNVFRTIETNEIFYDQFDEVICLPREVIPSLRNLYSFIRHIFNLKKQYNAVISRLTDVTELFFFSDLEKDIEILVELFIRNNKLSTFCLVDEGLAAYERISITSWKNFLCLKFVSIVCGLYRFNCTRQYGASRLYNKSLACEPERSVFRGPIEMMSPLSENMCNHYRSKIHNFKLLVDSPFFIYVSAYAIPKGSIFRILEPHEELSIMKQIESVVRNVGFNFYIKLHPIEDDKLYIPFFPEGTIIPNGYPIELFFNKNSIAGGATSSSLYNAALQGYTAVDITKIIDCNANRLSFLVPWMKIEKIDTLESLCQFLINKK